MEKYSIVITHYNQMDYIETAIKSVMIQNYPNIEIIIADDCSKTFDKNIVKKYIDKYNKNNFEYKIYSGKENVGTVKNLNNILKIVTGDYVQFFAADDKLFDENVVTNFVKAFKDKSKNIITSQCILYDENLDKIFSYYVNSFKSFFLNFKSSKSMYVKMSKGCFYGSGGTAYRMSVFDKYGYFNENYKYVEDWAYWVYVLRLGEKIYYKNFKSLCHRDGGISHSEYTKKTLPPHVRQYYKDILNIYVYEIFPYIDSFSITQKYFILNQFNMITNYYSSFAPELAPYYDYSNEIRNKSKFFRFFWKFKTFCTIFNFDLIYKIKILCKYNRSVPITVCIWFLLSNLLNIIINFKSVSFICFSNIVLYILIYYITFVSDKLIFYYKKRGGK